MMTRIMMMVMMMFAQYLQTITLHKSLDDDDDDDFDQVDNDDVYVEGNLYWLLYLTTSSIWFSTNLGFVRPEPSTVSSVSVSCLKLAMTTKITSWRLSSNEILTMCERFCCYILFVTSPPAHHYQSTCPAGPHRSTKVRIPPFQSFPYFWLQFYVFLSSITSNVLL